jgi:LuxR family maltose regulon positive regulatory protein
VLWIAARAGIESLGSFEGALRQALVAAGLPAMDTSLEDDRGAWLAGLSSISGAKPVLFIDDAQLLSDDIRDFIQQMIASARDALTTVIASRGECGIKLARLRSLGHLLEVRVQHLCFDTDEAARLIHQQVQGPMPPAEIQRIVVDTQGWAAGLILAAGAWQRDMAEGYPPEGGTTGLRHEFASYFHEEVIEGLPQDMRDFIIDTSILGELTPSACAAVVDAENARSMLEQVFERGLFLAELDRELSRYRYYTLFRDMVFGRLMMRAPDRAAELHRRASRFFANSGDLQMALDHAVQSGDKEFLAEQLELLADPIIFGGLLYRLDDLANDFSWDVLQGRPSLLLAMSWRRSRRLAFKSSERLIEAAESAIAAQVESGDLDEYGAEQMGFRVRHRRIVLEAARDNMVFVERHAEALLNDLGDDHPYLSCTLLAQLLSARRELYHFHDTNSGCAGQNADGAPIPDRGPCSGD